MTELEYLENALIGTRTMLAAMVHRAGGRVALTEKELVAVQGGRLTSMLDPLSGAVLLRYEPGGDHDPS